MSREAGLRCHRGHVASRPVPAPDPDLTPPPAFPGPAALGRGLVIEPGGAVPDAARDWPRRTIDGDALAEPDEAVAELDTAWRERHPTVVELAVPLTALKQPETCQRPPYELGPEFSFQRERLHFLVWANRYDGRRTHPRWHHVRRAVEIGARIHSPRLRSDGKGDVLLPDGTPAWIDGGPRGYLSGNHELADALVDGGAMLHVNQLWAGALQPDKTGTPGDDLAPDQAAAVRHPGGPARVLAPAGSGKTRVLTARLRHLLLDRGWAPHTVAALAYNNRAAAEMRARTRDLPDAQVRTLHSLGYEIVGRAPGQRPRLVDERDVRQLVEGLVPLRRRANDDVHAPYIEALAEVRSALRHPIEVERNREDVPGFADMFDAYRQRLQRMHAIDHDEQIYGAVEVLLHDTEVRRWVQRRCSHLLVDELQDLTPAQVLLIRLVAAPAYDVYGVGDDDQVIYGYAGADPRFLVDYQDFFPGATTYLLDVNYRCPAPIVQAASTLLRHNRQRVEKSTQPAPRRHPSPASAPTLGVPGAEGDDGRAPDAALTVERASETELGTRLVELLQAHLSGTAQPSHIAVLTRVNAGLLAPQMLLTHAGVPVVAAVDDRMLDRTGSAAALAWLRLALAASLRQPLDGRDLTHAARRPPRRLSRGVLAALGRGHWTLRRLARFADRLDDPRQRAGLESLHTDLARLARLARSGATTATLLMDIRDSVDLGDALRRLDGARTSTRGGHAEDLGALILVAAEHPDPSGFEPWLRQTLREARRGSNRGRDEVHLGDGVVLSTVHRVKGLEWPHIVIWDASEGMMPHRLSRSGAQLEEERRVFHVALTRAQESVSVLARAGEESPFVAEMCGLEMPRTSAAVSQRA
jgi:DNA helicase II / ATP-dependent DNA helicase PcrA